MQGPKRPLFYSHLDPVWSLYMVGTSYVPWVELPVQRRLCPIFHEWCWVTRHPRVFRGLTGSQRTPPILGRHIFQASNGFDCKPYLKSKQAM